MTNITPAAIVIPNDIWDSLVETLHSAYPAEGCGWLVGPKGGNTVTAARACKNQLNSPVAYAISDEDMLELASSFNTDMPARIIFHSHPNMHAYFSATDVKYATDPFGSGPTYPVQQLVLGINKERVSSAAMFAWSDEHTDFVEIARLRHVPRI